MNMNVICCISTAVASFKQLGWVSPREFPRHGVRESCLWSKLPETKAKCTPSPIRRQFKNAVHVKGFLEKVHRLGEFNASGLNVPPPIVGWLGRLGKAKETQPKLSKAALRCFLWVTQSLRFGHVIALRY